MSIPKSFFPFLTQLDQFSRKKIRVNTQGATTVRPGEMTIILLPEGKLDGKTFTLGGTATTTTSAGFAAIPNVECLIESMYIEVGSVSVHPAFLYYNQVWCMLSDLQGTWGRKGKRQILSVQPVSGTVAANQTAVPFQMNEWLGFLRDVAVLPTDRLPATRVYIKWAAPNVLACGPNGGTAAAGATYQLDNLYAQVDMLKLSPLYDQLISDKLSKAPLSIPFTNYQVIPGPVQGLTGSTRWSSTGNCIEKVFGTFLPTTYQATNQVGDATTYLSPAFNRGTANLASGFTSRFTVNGSSYPDQPQVFGRGEIFQGVLEVLNENHDLTTLQHPNLNSLANFGSKFFAHGVSFTYDDDESPNRACGLSGQAQQLIGSWESLATAGQSDEAMPLIIVQLKSVLQVGANRNVNYMH